MWHVPEACLCVWGGGGGGGGCKIQNVYRNVQICAHLLVIENQRSICWMLHTLVRSKKHACVKSCSKLLWKTPCNLHVLGPLYTRSQGQCSTQLKHSYWCKSWNQPQGLYTRSQEWTRKNPFNLSKVTSKCWTLWPYIGPKAGKRMSLNLGGQFATLGTNISAFINILTSMF